MHMRRIRERLSYANVISSMALFIALGGTSYALTLPHNSVGSTQIRSRAVGTSEIRTGAVRSSEVRNRSLGIQDLALRTRESLRGEAGPPGPPGATGQSGLTYREAIAATGALVRGNAISSGRRAPNEFLVGFRNSVDECVSTATLATVEGGSPTTPPAGRITVAREKGDVLVKTYDAAGSATFLPFHLIVAC